MVRASRSGDDGYRGRERVSEICTRGGINMQQWMIVSSLDGQAPDVTLYGEYAAPDKRLFASEAYARKVLAYLIRYSPWERCNSGDPIYRIVPVDEE